MSWLSSAANCDSSPGCIVRSDVGAPMWVRAFEVKGPRGGSTFVDHGEYLQRTRKCATGILEWSEPPGSGEAKSLIF